MVTRLPSDVKIRNYDEYKVLAAPPASVAAMQTEDENSSDDESLVSEFSLSSEDDL